MTEAQRQLGRIGDIVITRWVGDDLRAAIIVADYDVFVMAQLLPVDSDEPLARLEPAPTSSLAALRYGYFIYKAVAIP